ncbi:MAG TPA: hypothetical protein VM261_37495 [Kofleriaceae bacterium]|nr:hypothetical protein [Kofleriaceae bacterium]
MPSTATTVANAAGAVLTRTIGGIWLGGVVGVAVFAGEKWAGWLDASSGWGSVVVWLLLPLYIAAAAGAVGYWGFWSGIRQAARVILIDSGALRRMVDKLLARARRSADARAAADARAGGAEAADPPDEPAPRGWIGARIYAFGQSLARTVVDRMAVAAAPEAETGAQVDQIAEELISDAGLVPSIIFLSLLAATFAVAPLVLA